MIEIRARKVLVSCDSPRCPRAEEVEPTDGFQEEVRGELDRRLGTAKVHWACSRLEISGWFFERFPRRETRSFCPGRHADAYRTAFHRLRSRVSLLALVCLLGAGACGNVEVAPTEPDALVRGRFEQDAGSSLGGSGEVDSGAGGSAGAPGAGGSVGAGGNLGAGGAGGASNPDAGPVPLDPCPGPVTIVTVCSNGPNRTGECHLQKDDSQVVGCISDPVYKYTCVATCRPAA